MTDQNPDPYEAAGRVVLDMIERQRAASASRVSEVARMLGLAPEPAEAGEPEPAGWTAEEWADLMRRKAEHAAQVAEREAGAIHQTGAAVEGPPPASGEPANVADALLRDWRGGR